MRPNRLLVWVGTGLVCGLALLTAVRPAHAQTPTPEPTPDYYSVYSNPTANNGEGVDPWRTQYALIVVLFWLFTYMLIYVAGDQRLMAFMYFARGAGVALYISAAKGMVYVWAFQMIMYLVMKGRDALVATVRG